MAGYFARAIPDSPYQSRGLGWGPHALSSGTAQWLISKRAGSIGAFGHEIKISDSICCRATTV
jgi:hypothetical protein